MKAAGPDAAKLLRWYPRAWRERYGEEFLAMVEDWLDGGRPGWRLRLSVARAGLRERGHRARLAGQKGLLRAVSGGLLRAVSGRLLRAVSGKLWTWVVAGYIFVIFPIDFKASPPPARAWQATAALDVLTAVVVCTVVALLAGGLMAVPALARYLRAGGWPEIRRRMAWAAGATAAAGGALAWLLFASWSHTFSQLNDSLAYLVGVLVTTMALVVALWRWSCVVTAMAKRLDLAPRVRSAEKMLGVVAASTVYATISANVVWYSVIKSSAFLLIIGTVTVAGQCVTGCLTIGRAARSARRRRLAPARGR